MFFSSVYVFQEDPPIKKIVGLSMNWVYPAMGVKESISLPAFEFISPAHQFQSKTVIYHLYLIMLSEILTVVLKFIWSLTWRFINGSKNIDSFPNWTSVATNSVKSTQTIMSSNREVVFIKHKHPSFFGIWWIIRAQWIISWYINIRVTSLNERI